MNPELKVALKAVRNVIELCQEHPVLLQRRELIDTLDCLREHIDALKAGEVLS